MPGERNHWRERKLPYVPSKEWGAHHWYLFYRIRQECTYNPQGRTQIGTAKADLEWYRTNDMIREDLVGRDSSGVYMLSRGKEIGEELEIYLDDGGSFGKFKPEDVQ